MTHSPHSEDTPAPFVLIILDGFGLADPDAPGNAITPRTAPHIFHYLKEYPHARLAAHGEAVGLRDGQEGNSEAGHFAIGAGRAVLQDAVAITHTIEEGTFFKNAAFLQGLAAAKERGKAVHLMGLLTNHNSAHAHPEHLYALLDLCKRKGIKKTYLHIFTDGRDSSPHGAMKFLRELRARMHEGQMIASVMGRFYAMDRNKIWERTEQAYHTIVEGKAPCRAHAAEEAIEQAYNRGETDEYICPSVICDERDEPVGPVQDGDTIIFFNTRSDRARQLAKAFVQHDFQRKNPGAFRRRRVVCDMTFIAMSEFGPDLPDMITAFPSADIPYCLAQAIGEGRKQLYISETEKYAHVTYFINGGYANPINGEDREMIQSPPERSYANHPHMRSKDLADRIISYVHTGQYDFICVNFPNADMVGHTGNIDAAQKGIHFLDAQVGRIVDTVLNCNGTVIITADHGNAEEMIDVKTGEMKTQHTTNPVPFVVVQAGCAGQKAKRARGTLADVAPTVLHLLGLPKPKTMTGKSLM